MGFNSGFNGLIPFTERSFYFEKPAKYVNTPYGKKKKDYFSVKAGGTYSNHCVLKDRKCIDYFKYINIKSLKFHFKITFIVNTATSNNEVDCILMTENSCLFVIFADKMALLSPLSPLLVT